MHAVLASFATVELPLSKGHAGVVLLLDEAQFAPDERTGRASIRSRCSSHRCSRCDAASCPWPSCWSGRTRRRGNVNVLLGRLVDAGALYRIRKGEYAYTAPKFKEHLERHARDVRVD